MLTRLHILFILCLLGFCGYSQEGTFDAFKIEISSLSPDSIFLKIDEKLAKLDSTGANDQTISDLLQVKVEMADSLENRYMKYYAYQEMLKHSSHLDGSSTFSLLRKIAKMQSGLNLVDEVMVTYFDAAALADSLENDTLLATAYSYIGTEYKKQNNAELSLKYLRLSLQYNESLQDSIGIIGNYMTMGNAYKLKREEDSAYIDTALFYYNKSLELSIEQGYMRGIAGNRNNIGNVYRYQNKLQESLDQFFRALEINQEAENQQWISYNYHNIGMTYQEMNKHSSAITYLQKSLALKEELNDRPGISGTYLSISTSYANLGQYKKAYESVKKHVSINTELQQAEKNRLSQELEAKFQNDKKEAEISKLMAERQLQVMVIEEKQKDLDHQAQLRDRKIYLIYALGFILVSLIIIIIVFWRNNQQRKKYTETLKIKNVAIEQASVQIDNARATLELKNQEVTDSINYAKRIQAAILPSQKRLTELLNQAFVLYKPKDIVAGDFYWTEKVGDCLLFAVADCTGHGVPGAMVSVICHNALNTTIKQMGLTDPGKILDETTQLVIQQFEKSEEEVRDGMDIALCSFDTVNRTLRYAGANTPLWIVRNGEVIKHNGSRQPVGKHANLTHFESNNIFIQKGDFVYMSSDGYADQFGGEKGKKFMYRRFRELLAELAKLPIDEQAKVLAERFYAWKGSYEQVDDVCVLGTFVDR